MTREFVSGFTTGVQFAIAALEYRTPKGELLSEAMKLLDRLGEQGASDQQADRAVLDYALGRDTKHGICK